MNISPNDTTHLVDHINHDVADNRKRNLRIVTSVENQMNKSLQKNNTSGVTGVSWHSRDNIWEVHIRYKGKQIYLGRYKDFNEAVKARKEAEEKYFGEYSYNNSVNSVKEVQK
jgi:tyrosyl-tRNA synthetase